MPLTINTNMAASRASYFLSKNNDALQKSLDRLSSGKKITQPADDAGGLAVSMKMQGEIDNLKGAANNVSNALSFLQVQDGILDSVAQIVGRMSELKGLSQDVLKSTSDIDTYNSEFADLQQQLFDLSQTQFNGVNLFSDTNTFKTAAGAVQGGDSLAVDVSGQTVNIHQASLQGALTLQFTKTAGVLSAHTSNNIAYADTNTGVDHDATGDGDGTGFANEADGNVTRSIAVDTLAAGADGVYLRLDDLDSTSFNHLLDNIATLRSTNGGQASRLQYSQESIATQSSNMEAALGRILDVDIAAETTNLAKQQILVQASASMVAQANSANQVALMLLQ
jgi:flagellin